MVRMHVKSQARRVAIASAVLPPQIIGTEIDYSDRIILLLLVGYPKKIRPSALKKGISQDDHLI